MAICSSGISRPKAGVANQISIDANAASLLSVIPQLAGLSKLAYLLTGISYLTPSLCAIDPPAMPTLTLAEVTAMALNNFSSADYRTGLSKLKDIVQRLAWFELCECASVATPSLPTPTAPPALPTSVGVPAASNSSICSTYGPVTTSWASSGYGRLGQYITLGKDAIPTLIGERLKLTSQNPGPGASDVVNIDIRKYASRTGVTFAKGVYVDSATISVGQTYDRTFAVDPAFPYTYWWAQTPGSPPNQTYTELREGYCSGGPGVGPCVECPPDPMITQMLNNIYSTVTLLQRQLAPFAYVPGAAHAGLTGHGSFAVQGLLGAKIVITSDPTTLGETGFSPVELFDRGYITWGTADGYPQSERLERTNQLSLPARASAFTSLAYDLHPGVTVTITELVREA
jgi:hypothetical protein